MTSLPLGRRRRLEKRVENVWHEGGWGPVRTWWVRRPGRVPLAFHLRVPLRFELIDVAELADVAAGASAIVARGATALNEAAAAGVFLAGTLRTTKEPEAERITVATLTVAISDEVTGPPLVEEIEAGLPVDPHTRHEIIKHSDTTVEIISVTTREGAPDTETPELFVDQFLVQTPFGALAFVFSTTLRDAMTARARTIYINMANTASIGERPEAQ